MPGMIGRIRPRAMAYVSADAATVWSARLVLGAFVLYREACTSSFIKSGTPDVKYIPPASSLM